MLLKSTFVPLFTAIPARGNPGKFSVSSVRNVVAQRCTPTSRQNGSSNATSLLLLHKLPSTSAYIHLPFCRKRCHYCDFPIIALGSSSSTPGNDKDDPRILNYLETLCREIKATKLDSANSPPLETVFFGGGTPSLVPPRLVSSVLDALSSKFGVCSNAEISMEMDPGTFDAGKLKELMNLGVNRVSLGVQAFQEELLKACGRAHGVREVYDAVKIVKSCGVENWSIDLISSLPHQTLSIWEESLQLTIQAQPTHVSVYDLQVEQDTKFGVLYSPGEFPLPSENQSAEFYRVASRMLRDAGYDHYEISSYCKSGYRCKHNSTYWKNKPFYAFGMGSASYVNGVRFSRPRRLKDYMDYVQNLENGLMNCSEDDMIDAKDLAMDVVMLSLRTADGLDLKSFKEAFDGQGRTIAVNEFLSSFSNEFWRNEKLAFLRLSDPDGFLLSNELISLAFGAMAT
ncbi:Heme chaperone HemW [Sesamum alatum]|uniref:Radical S-adenosyl methionine domain-containing protein 1, mitochondrial n=1 Tax=Sesamum alatum TaxID=300844 RepID=A0AAE1YW87_9LAMI|nr:Heme chaperone HemW [Sesamum alatum]